MITDQISDVAATLVERTSSSHVSVSFCCVISGTSGVHKRWCATVGTLDFNAASSEELLALIETGDSPRTKLLRVAELRRQADELESSISNQELK